MRRLADLEPGDHLCCIYETEEEHRALLAPFLRHGLEHGQKVLYIVDAHTAEEVLAYLEEEGVHVRSYLDSGQLSVLTADESYMREGRFDPDGMIDLLRRETAQALSEGYSALRVTGEMTWALRGLPGSERLVEYEAKLNRFFPGSRCVAVCQYDRRKFGPDLLLDVLTTHPVAVVGTEVYENFYYIPPDKYLGDRLTEAMLDNWLANLAARQASEAALQESEEKYRTIVDGAQEGIWVIDADGNTTFANRRLADMLGYGVDEMMGRPIYDFMDQEGREAAERNMERRRSGIREQHDFEFIARDGSRIYASLETSPLFDDAGDFVGGVAMVADITRRREMEKALAREVEVNRVLAELSSALLVLGPIEDISYLFLESAKRLTESPYGFVGYIDTQTGYLVSPTLTRDIWEACEVEGKDVVFRDFTGLWGWVLKNRRPLLSNAPREDSRSSGVPEGHIPIERFLSVPALMGRTLVGQIAVANSVRDYDRKDLDLLGRLADLYAIAVLRMWSEGELERYREHLEELVRERTNDLERMNEQLQREIAERRKKEEELRVNAERLRALSARLESFREEERRRISLEVHDRLGQALTGLKINLALLGKKVAGEAELEERIADMSALLDETIQSVREISTALRPGVLDDLGLAVALDWQLRQFAELTGVECSLTSHVDEVSLDREMNVALFRIAQEALTNVARHARASRVDVRLACEEGEVVLEVRDDGRGASEEEVEDAGALGILGMRERARVFGGEVAVQGKRGEGTALLVRIPLRRGGCKAETTGAGRWTWKRTSSRNH